MRKISSMIGVVLIFCAAISLSNLPVLGQVHKLDMWTLTDVAINEFLGEVIKEFEQMRPNVKIKLTTAENDPYKTKYEVAVAGGDPPDIFFNWAGEDVGHFVRAGLLMDLTEAMQEKCWSGEKTWKDTFTGLAISNAIYGDKIYLVSRAQLGKFFFYNEEMFDKYGFQVPQDWHEFMDILNTVKTAGIYPIAFGNRDRWPGCHYITTLDQKFVGLAQYLEDSYLKTENEKLFKDPGYVKALDRLNFLNKEGYFNPGVNSITMEVARSLLFSKAALYYGGTWNIAYYEGAGAAGEVPKGFKFGMFSLPDIPEGKGNQDVVWGLAEGYNISSKTKYAEDAIEFLKYFTSLEIQRRQVKELSQFSPVKGAITEDIASAHLVQAAKILAEAPAAVMVLDTLMEPRVVDVYLDAIQSVLVGQLSSEEAMERVSQKAQEVKEEIGPIIY